MNKLRQTNQLIKTYVDGGGASSDFKFDLYVKNKEVSEIYQQLLLIQAKSPTQKADFLQQNKYFLAELGDELCEKLVSTMADLELDQESIPLMLEYTTGVRDAYNLWREILGSATN